MQTHGLLTGSSASVHTNDLHTKKDPEKIFLGVDICYYFLFLKTTITAPANATLTVPSVMAPVLGLAS